MQPLCPNLWNSWRHGLEATLLIILVVSTTLLNLSLTKFLAQMHNQRSKQTSAVFPKANRASNRGNISQMTSTYRLRGWENQEAIRLIQACSISKKQKKRCRHAGYSLSQNTIESSENWSAERAEQKYQTKSAVPNTQRKQQLTIIR